MPGRDGDFVFFVTFGQKQGDHVFDEGITTDGVLTWQSQPKQTLSDRQIQQFIRHNEDLNSIYLFLRTSPGKPYTYLGKLKYLAHDRDREQPVYFQWQILDWNIPKAILDEIALSLEPSASALSPRTESNRPELLQTNPPTQNIREPGKPLETTEFRARKIADYLRITAKDARIGKAGELLVVRYEQQSLLNAGKPELAERVRHIADLEGDGAGYDIESFTAEGNKKYIEVKTTISGKDSDFFITANELQFAKQHADHFYLYRLFEYDENSDTGKFFILRAPIEQFCGLFAIQYRVSVRPT